MTKVAGVPGGSFAGAKARLRQGYGGRGSKGSVMRVSSIQRPVSSIKGPNPPINQSPNKPIPQQTNPLTNEQTNPPIPQILSLFSTFEWPSADEAFS